MPLNEVWRIVVVDDSADNRADIRQLLLTGSARRYAFTEAETGAAAIHAIRSATTPPDCVVLDFNLPDIDALAVLAALADPDGIPICAVVVLTGNASTELGRAALRAGAQDYVGDGWLSPLVLTRAVENATERWAMARDLQQRQAALRLSEQHYRALATASADIAYRMSADWSPDGKHIAWMVPNARYLTSAVRAWDVQVASKRIDGTWGPAKTVEFHGPQLMTAWADAGTSLVAIDSSWHYVAVPIDGGAPRRLGATDAARSSNFVSATGRRERCCASTNPRGRTTFRRTVSRSARAGCTSR